MIRSRVTDVGAITLPQITGKHSMLPFNLKTLAGLTGAFKEIAADLTKHLKIKEGTAFLTIHGRQLVKGETLRRPQAHIDGNYMNYVEGETFISFGRGGGNGWKLGEAGPYITEQEHKDSYDNEDGGIITASTVSSCIGFQGDFEGSPARGGDCTHIDLGKGEKLDANKIYYGNNRFVHESLPIDRDTHRTFVRVTLPITHKYEGK